MESACYRTVFDVPQADNTQKNIYFMLSRRGLEKYAQLNLDVVFNMLRGQSLGDISFSVAGIKFYLKNLKIQSISNPEVSISFSEPSNSGYIIMRDANMRLVFDFIMEQYAYPYLYDSGTGKLLLEIGNMGFRVQVPENKECGGQFLFNISDASCQIAGIKTEFDSKMAFILNSIMPILNSYLMELFNDEIGSSLIVILVDDIFASMANFRPLSAINFNTGLAYDYRWIEGVFVYDRSMEIAASGLSCEYNADTDTCNRSQSWPDFYRTPYQINADISYEVSRNVFSSAYSYVWKFKEALIREEYGIENVKIEVTKIVNTGMVTEMNYTRDGKQCSIQFLGYLRHKRASWSSDGVIVIWMRPGLDRVTKVIGEDPIYAEALRAGFDILLDSFAFTAYNGFNVDFENASVVYVNNDWFFVGAEVKPDA